MHKMANVLQEISTAAHIAGVCTNFIVMHMSLGNAYFI